MSKIDVTVIVVNYNTLKLTDECIKSLFAKTTDISYELILVDNASTDGSIDYFKSYDNIIFTPNTDNLGFGAANNIGIGLSKGRNVLFLNPDTVLINNAIKIMSDYLDNNPGVGVCGCNLTDDLNKPAKSLSRFFPGFIDEINACSGNRLQKLKYGENSYFNYSSQPLKVAYVSGAAMMIKKEVLEKTGGFNEVFFLFFEETELCRRVFKKGYKICSLPDARIRHLVSKSFIISDDKMKHYYLSKQRYFSLVFSPIKIGILNLMFKIHRSSRLMLAMLLKEKEVVLSLKKHLFHNKTAIESVKKK